MGRLSALKPRLAAAPSRLHRATDERSLDRRRLADTETRRLYKTARWRELRMSVLRRDLFTCQLQDCGRIESDTSQLVCDHIEPHRGDVGKFWAGPFHTLCKRCHDSVKQKEEIAARTAGLDVYGGKPASYRPDWLRPSLIPLTIVCGPPASGKNWYVKQRAGLDDQIIDLDQIACAVSGKPFTHQWDRSLWLDMAMRGRNAMLGALSKKRDFSAAWLIMGEPNAQHRQWWADKLQPKAIIVIAADEATCMAHTAHDADRDMHHTALQVRRWWSEYKPRPGDQVVRS
jgi:5-methylcytosine-specific restriction endonuclease McrA